MGTKQGHSNGDEDVELSSTIQNSDAVSEASSMVSSGPQEIVIHLEDYASLLEEALPENVFGNTATLIDSTADATNDCNMSSCQAIIDLTEYDTFMQEESIPSQEDSTRASSVRLQRTDKVETLLNFVSRCDRILNRLQARQERLKNLSNNNKEMEEVMYADPEYKSITNSVSSSPSEIISCIGMDETGKTPQHPIDLSSLPIPPAINVPECLKAIKGHESEPTNESDSSRQSSLEEWQKFDQILTKDCAGSDAKSAPNKARLQTSLKMRPSSVKHGIKFSHPVEHVRIFSRTDEEGNATRPLKHVTINNEKSAAMARIAEKLRLSRQRRQAEKEQELLKMSVCCYEPISVPTCHLTTPIVEPETPTRGDKELELKHRTSDAITRSWELLRQYRARKQPETRDESLSPKIKPAMSDSCQRAFAIDSRIQPDPESEPEMSLSSPTTLLSRSTPIESSTKEGDTKTQLRVAEARYEPFSQDGSPTTGNTDGDSASSVSSSIEDDNSACSGDSNSDKLSSLHSRIDKLVSYSQGVRKSQEQIKSDLDRIKERYLEGDQERIKIIESVRSASKKRAMVVRV